MARAKRQTVILHHKRRVMAHAADVKPARSTLRTERTVDSAVVLKRLPATSALRAEGGGLKSGRGGRWAPATP